jgi:hypothetical protein
MVSPKAVTAILSELTLMKFFPSDRSARTALVGIFCGMADTEDQVRYVVRKALATFDEWPGMATMRAIFCERFKPRDGIMAYPDPEKFTFGFPSDHPVEVPAMLALPPGSVSADHSLEAPIAALAAMKSMLPPARPVRVPDVPVNVDFKPITQADIDREVSRLRDAAGAIELHGIAGGSE